MTNAKMLTIAALTALGSFSAGAAVSLPKGYVALEYLWATNAEQYVSTGIKASAKEKFRITLDQKEIPLVTNAADGVILSGKLPQHTHSFSVVRLDTKVDKPKEKDKPAVTSIVEKVLADYMPVRTDKGAAVFYDLVSKRTYDTAVKGAAFKPGYPGWQFVLAPITNVFVAVDKPICPIPLALDKTTGAVIPEKELKFAYTNNVVGGKATVFVTGEGGVHTGMVSTTFTIQSTYFVTPALDSLKPLRGSFTMPGVTDNKYHGVEVSMKTNTFADCRVKEFSFVLSCPRDNRTPVIDNIWSADFTLPFAADDEIVVWNGIGETWCDKDHPRKNYSFERTPLAAGKPLAFEASFGCSSSWAFPYFRVYSAKSGKGWTVALGYQGEWALKFERTDEGVHLTGGQRNLRLYLNRNEAIITPTVTLQEFDSADDAVNAWRRFMRAHVLPKDTRGPGVIRPMLCCDGYESGELYTQATAARMLEQIKALRERGFRFDAWWVDAGWYTPKAYEKKGNRALWWETVGEWKCDPERFPKGLGPVAGELEKDGAKLVLWYEPERIHSQRPNLEQEKRYCFSIETNSCWRYWMGNGETQNHLASLIGDSIAANGVGIYREDCNQSGEDFFKHFDGKAKDRAGIHENWYMQGRYRYWALLKKRFPKMIFDICCAGGRRNDLSALRNPAVPLHYSDVACEVATFPELQRCQHMLNQWFIYRKNLGGHRAKTLADQITCLAPFQVVYAKQVLDDQTAPEARKLLALWHRIAPLMIDGDYYLLTEEKFGEDQWWASEFADPKGELFAIQAVRNAKASGVALKVQVQGLDGNARYEATDLVSGKALELGENGSLELKLGAGEGTVAIIRRKDAVRTMPAYSSESYVQEGLYAQFDGIENAGRGIHSDKGDRWVNLVRERWSLVKTGKGVLTGPVENGFRFYRGEQTRYEFGDAWSWWSSIGKEWTFEATIVPHGGFRSNHAGIMGDHRRDAAGVVFGQYAGDNRGSGIGFHHNRNADSSGAGGVSVKGSGIPLHEPIHLAFVCDGTMFYLYTNSVLAATNAVISKRSTALGAPAFAVGRAYPDDNRFFDGIVNSVRVYSRALAAEEVAKNSKIDLTRFYGLHAESADAEVACEGDKSLVVGVKPIHAPATPTQTVARVAFTYFNDPRTEFAPPTVDGISGYLVTNEEEGVVWNCTKVERVSTSRERNVFDFTFVPTAFRITTMKAAGGTIEPASVWSPAGGAVSFKAVPASGYSFYRWLKGVDSDCLMKAEAVLHAKGPASVAVEFEKSEISDSDFEGF